MRSLAALLIAALIVVGVWWYASPIWTLRAMRDAAKDRDQTKLSAYVDYPALREDLKHDIGDYVAVQAGKGIAGQGGRLAARIARGFADPVVDDAVSPAGVEAMFASEDRIRAVDGRLPAPVRAGDHPIIERNGLNSFRVHGADASKGALVFRREGLGWTLVGVELPRPRPASATRTFVPPSRY